MVDSHSIHYWLPHVIDTDEYSFQLQKKLFYKFVIAMTLSECNAIATKKSTHIVQQLHVPRYPCTAVPCTRMASYTVQRTHEASTVFSLLMFWSINDKRCTSLSNAFSDATDGKFSIPNIFAEKNNQILHSIFLAMNYDGTTNVHDLCSIDNNAECFRNSIRYLHSARQTFTVFLSTQQTIS